MVMATSLDQGYTTVIYGKFQCLDATHNPVIMASDDQGYNVALIYETLCDVLAIDVTRPLGH